MTKTLKGKGMAEPFDKQIGQRIREFRNQRGISQAALG